MKRNCTIALLLCGMLVLGLATAQEKAEKAAAPETGEKEEAARAVAVDGAAVGEDAAVHDELRALRKTLTEAVKSGDIDSQLAHVHKNVVATWQNNRVVRGTDGLRDFLKEMDAQNKKVFQGYKVEPEADDLTILHGGDAGIVFGRSVPKYHYLGMDFELENRWTATLVKEDGAWKIAAYHVSANVVDNPVLNAAKSAAYWAGGVCLVVGVVLGLIVSAAMRKRAQPRA
jgi:ketosteroid isomerase-like protein